MPILTYTKKIKLIVILIVIGLSGCVDLSGSRSTYGTNKHLHASYNTRYYGEVHTMLGGLGIFSKGMNTLRVAVSDRYDIPAYGTIWYNAGHVTRFIIDNYYRQGNHAPIILVGHSLGANDQIKVARNLNKVGIPVALLITVDAVSQTIVPSNVHQAVNFYKSGYVPMFSGLKLKAADPSKTSIENINAATLKGIKVNHFTIDKNPLVQEMILERIKKVITDGKQKRS